MRKKSFQDQEVLELIQKDLELEAHGMLELVLPVSIDYRFFSNLLEILQGLKDRIVFSAFPNHSDSKSLVGVTLFVTL